MRSLRPITLLESRMSGAHLHRFDSQRDIGIVEVFLAGGATLEDLFSRGGSEVLPRARPRTGRSLGLELRAWFRPASGALTLFLTGTPPSPRKRKRRGAPATADLRQTGLQSHSPPGLARQQPSSKNGDRQNRADISSSFSRPFKAGTIPFFLHSIPIELNRRV